MQRFFSYLNIIKNHNNHGVLSDSVDRFEPTIQISFQHTNLNLLSARHTSQGKDNAELVQMDHYFYCM